MTSAGRVSVSWFRSGMSNHNRVKIRSRLARLQFCMGAGLVHVWVSHGPSLKYWTSKPLRSLNWWWNRINCTRLEWFYTLEGSVLALKLMLSLNTGSASHDTGEQNIIRVLRVKTSFCCCECSTCAQAMLLLSRGYLPVLCRSLCLRNQQCRIVTTNSRCAISLSVQILSCGCWEDYSVNLLSLCLRSPTIL